MDACHIAARDLACRRGDVILFTGLSLELRGSQALILSGPNGVGKSSLLRILAGLLRPVAGTVEREGQVALSDERAALAADASLLAALSFWARMDGRSDVGGALAQVGLERQAEVPVRYLSTGQRKRAAFARVLLQGAPIWLLDEPLNGLDRAAEAMVHSAIAEHRERGGIAIVASHQPVDLPGAQSLSLGAAA